ncbi:hypothetical protein BX666DRAFT_551481 [Dichotomocladium elegans]|nr:hypothetical protein BX666DRAFT_551481 [Dichotomocladium elegans]
MLKRSRSDKNGDTNRPTTPPAKRVCKDSSWTAAFERGKIAFAQSKFEDAIREFTDAIALHNNITLYDCRAAAYEKLGQIAQGLEDALRMIKLQPTQSKGYLRAGKLLLIQGRAQKAANVYQRALKNVNRTDSRYAIIEKMVTQTKADAARVQQPYDLVKLLPYDILDMIFERVSFDRRVQCMAVCRSWRFFLLHWSGMWRELTLTHRMSIYAIKQYMSYVVGRCVRKITLIGQKKPRMSTVLQLIINRDCHYLERLELIHCEIPRDVFSRVIRLMCRKLQGLTLVNTGLPIKVVFQDLLQACPTVSELICHDDEQSYTDNEITIPKPLILTHISLSPVHIPFSSMKHILQHCPHLRYLALHPSPSEHVLASALELCPDLVMFASREQTGPWPNYHGKGLRELVIPTSCEIAESVIAATIGAHRATLEVLDLRGCIRLTHREASAIASASVDMARLRELRIECSMAFTESDLCNLMRPTLEIVHLTSMTTVTNKVIGTLIEQQLGASSALRQLDVSNCPNVTGAWIRKLLSDAPQLQKLTINNCVNIRPDAVEFACSKLGRRAVEWRFR